MKKLAILLLLVLSVSAMGQPRKVRVKNRSLPQVVQYDTIPIVFICADTSLVKTEDQKAGSVDKTIVSEQRLSGPLIWMRGYAVRKTIKEPYAWRQTDEEEVYYLDFKKQPLQMLVFPNSIVRVKQ